MLRAGVLRVAGKAGVHTPSCSPDSVFRNVKVLAKDAAWLITMGCGDACPAVPGLRRDDWPLDDPKGQPLERVRQIRDEIRRRVEVFLLQQAWM